MDDSSSIAGIDAANRREKAKMDADRTKLLMQPTATDRVAATLEDIATSLRYISERLDAYTGFEGRRPPRRTPPS